MKRHVMGAVVATLVLLSGCSQPQSVPKPSTPVNATGPRFAVPEVEGFKVLQEHPDGFEIVGPSTCHYLVSRSLQAQPTDAGDLADSNALLKKSVDSLRAKGSIEDEADVETIPIGGGMEMQAQTFSYRPEVIRKINMAVAVRVSQEDKASFLVFASCDGADFQRPEWNGVMYFLKTVDTKAQKFQ